MGSVGQRIGASGLLALGGCSLGSFESDGGTYRMLAGLEYPGRVQRAAVMGSRFCPDVDEARDGERVEHFYAFDEHCFSYEARSGQELDDEGCFRLDDPGELSVVVAPTGRCPSSDGFASDIVRVEVVSPERVTAGVRPLFDVLEATYFERPDGSPLPVRNRVAMGRTVRVVEGGWFAAGVYLYDQAGRAVGYDPDLFEVTLAARSGGYTTEDSELQQMLVLEPDTVLEAAAGPYAAGTIVSVPASAVDTLELEVGRFVDAPFEPVVRAVTRDRAGQLLYAAPVEWSFEGDPVILELAADDYVYVSDVCTAPPRVPTARSVVLQARVGELVQRVEVLWTAAPAEDDADPFEPDPDCAGSEADAQEALTEPGCGCRRRIHDGAWPWVLALAFVRRRRTG